MLRVIDDAQCRARGPRIGEAGVLPVGGCQSRAQSPPRPRALGGEGGRSLGSSYLREQGKFKQTNLIKINIITLKYMGRL